VFELESSTWKRLLIPEIFLEYSAAAIAFDGNTLGIHFILDKIPDSATIYNIITCEIGTYYTPENNDAAHMVFSLLYIYGESDEINFENAF